MILGFFHPKQEKITQQKKAQNQERTMKNRVKINNPEIKGDSVNTWILMGKREVRVKQCKYVFSMTQKGSQPDAKSDSGLG